MTVFYCKGVCKPRESGELTEFEVTVSGWSFVEAEANAITKMRFSHNCRDIRVMSIAIDEDLGVNEAEAS